MALRTVCAGLAVAAVLAALAATPLAAEALGLDAAAFRLSGVELREDPVDGKPALRITMPRSAWQDESREKPTDRNYMAWLPLDFGDGEIEVELYSDLAPGAPAYARGFIGLAFRIDGVGRFESIYLRPTNSEAADQVRRNHSVQYAAFPDYRFDHLRSAFPEKYETWADLSLRRWIHMRIVVEGETARLYLDRNPRPAFIVTDLKYGAAQRGGVGVWLESGTVAHFRGLKVAGAGGDGRKRAER